MSLPAHFARIAMPEECRETAKVRYAAFAAAGGGELGWVGLAAEAAVVRASRLPARMAATREYDFDLVRKLDEGLLRCELKTRAVGEGWLHPERFDYVVVPTHGGRAPIKRAVDLIFFAWWTGSDPDHLWVLGYVRGAEEFRRRAIFYPEDAPLPRGGWAPPGGAYCIEVNRLRPLPRDLFEEVK